MAQLLHIADIHFGAPLRSKDGRLRALLRQATSAAFEAAVSFAIHEEVDAVLIAGDLFDSGSVALETELFLRTQFHRLKTNDIRVFVSPGNHDSVAAMNSGRTIDWPDNVHFFRSQTPETVQITTDSGPIKIVGAAHESPAVRENIVASFPRSDGSAPHIGLVHAMVTSPTGAVRTAMSAVGDSVHERYAPCTAADLRHKNYSYWALGHIHVPGQIGGLSAFYAGCIQGRHHKEGGPRGGYLVSIDASGFLRTEFVPFAKLVWDEVAIVELPDSLSELESVIASRLQECRESNVTASFAVRLILRGPTALYSELQDDDELAALVDRWMAEFELEGLEIETGHVYPRIDLGALRNEPTVLGEALRLIDTIRENGIESVAEAHPDLLADIGAPESGGLLARDLDLDRLENRLAQRLVVRTEIGRS
ncbi:MAG: DNA repair exonuclease [Rhodothermales bacterium]